MIGLSLDAALTVGGLAASANVDLMAGLNYNLAVTKQKASESSFELLVEPCRPVDLQAQTDTGEFQDRPGMVS
jgi:hypothetical protein